MKDPTAVVIVYEGVEEIEALAPVDCLRRASVEVIVCSASPSKRITGRNGIRMEADVRLQDLSKQPFDLVVVPGGPGHARLLDNADLLDRLREQDSSGRWIGSICAGPVVLDKAGVLKDREFTSFPGTAEALPGRDPDRKVIRDGHLVTAQGAGCAIEFALALVEALCGEARRREIADAICA